MATELLRVPRPKSLPMVRGPSQKSVDEYAEIAEQVGVGVGILCVDQFARYLRKADIAVYDLERVKKYMDAKTKAEAKHGWEWRPLRTKDRISGAFGKPGRAARFRWHWRDGETRTPARPASDYYSAKLAVYTRQVPLHALKKVAKIEAENPKAGAVFMVTDYAPKKATIRTEIQRPVDPFLMVCIENPKLDEGIGRWVIDFWDEPGFGLKLQLGV